MSNESEVPASTLRPDIASTGIDGLDEILHGGLPRGALYLVQGHPGVGKTTLALQFLFAGREAGERTLYVSLSETRPEIEAVVRSHGWTLEGISVFELGAENRLQTESAQTMFHPAELELEETTKPILQEVERIRPSRVVVDSLSEIRLLARDALRYRRQVLALKQYFLRRQCTVLLLDDQTLPLGDTLLESIAHGVLLLEKRAPNFGRSRRRLTIEKLRGVGFLEGYHDLKLAKGGIQVFPRIATEQPLERLRPGTRISSDIPELDSLLGGGLDPGTSVLFMGPAGCGKSTLALRYAWAAAERGEEAAIYQFDERIDTVLTRAAALGMPLEGHLASGRIHLQHIDPAELSPGEFLHDIRQRAADGRTRLFVVDSLNGYFYAMPDEQALMLQLHELFTHLAGRKLTTLLTLAQPGLFGPATGLPIDVSYVADTTFQLRFFEASGKVRRALSVVKRRAGEHESTIREIQFVTGTIRLGKPLEELEGVLSGVPAYRGTKDALLNDDPDDPERRT